MRIHIRHEIVHAYEPPVRFLNAALRLTPRSHESQHVVRWRVEIDGDSRIRASDDAFGNCMHTLSVTGPTAGLRIMAEGIVETFDAAGIVRATVERFPPEFYLRETPLTEPGEAHRALAADLRADNPIERLHALLLHMPSLEAREETQTQQAGEQSQSQRRSRARTRPTRRRPRGSRTISSPARGSRARRRASSAAITSIPKLAAGGAHCWAEAYVEGVGWIGFDPANVICPHESHVRMAIGLDALDAACVRAAPAPASITSSAHVTRADARQS